MKEQLYILTERGWASWAIDKTVPRDYTGLVAHILVSGEKHFCRLYFYMRGRYVGMRAPFASETSRQKYAPNGECPVCKAVESFTAYLWAISLKLNKA